MGGLTLLREAQAAGLTVTVVDGQLVMTGPKTAREIAGRLAANKADVVRALGAGSRPASADATVLPEDEWTRGMRSAMAPVIDDPPPGCYGPFACARLGPCGRVVARGGCPGIHAHNGACDSPRPLDEVIAADLATTYPHAEIVGRVERLAAAAARPEATPLNQVVLDDWRAILAAKENMS